MFSKYETFFLDQANFRSYQSQILILKYLILRASLPLSPSLQHNPQYVLHQFPYFVLANLTIRHKYWIYQTVCQAKALKFIIKLYADHQKLWHVRRWGSLCTHTRKKKIMVKHATHRKLDSYKSRFSFKIRQHGKQQLSLQYKVSRILYKILGTP